MFEAAEVGRRVAKRDYKVQEKELRTGLLAAQFALQQARVPLLLIFEGVDNSSKGEVVNLLQEWLDARGMSVNAFGPKSDEERERPRMWRYWRTLPGRGQIAVFAGSWYTGPLLQQVFGERTPEQFDQQMQALVAEERLLALDGMLILKFWLHLSKADQQERFRKLQKQSGSRWIVSQLDRQLQRRYRKLMNAAERMIRQSDVWLSPWIIVEAADSNYRNLTIGKTILAAMQRALAQEVPAAETHPAAGELLQEPEGEFARRSILDTIDLSRQLKAETYERQLAKYQRELLELSWEAYHKGVSTVLLFEGWDAAGKGSAIRRLLQAIDARIVRVIQIAAPTDEERAHHYLWRFWRHLPRAGRVTIYDRSWYGRVLIERVEGLAQDAEWQRAYSEINHFEAQLRGHGVLLAKFWLHIDADEQLRRFHAREETPHKRHKITDEDYRNRARWDDYEQAVNEMVVRTSTSLAPWHLIAANDKKFARIQVLRAVCKLLDNALRAQR